MREGTGATTVRSCWLLIGLLSMYPIARGTTDNAYSKVQISSNDFDGGIPTPRTAT